MSKEYVVRPYRPGDDEEIVELLQLVFDGWPHFDLNSTPLEHWRWKFKENPLGITLIALAEMNTKVIGTIHGIPRKIKIGDEVFLCNTGADLAVHPDFRKRGISSEIDGLITKLETESGIRFVYWITGNPIVIKRDSRHYASFPHTVINLVRIRDIDEQLRAMPVENEWLMRLGFRASKVVNDIKSVVRRSEPRNLDLTINKIDQFDEKIDAFWEDVSSHYEFIVERRRDYLNWRYCDPRAGDFDVRLAHEDGEIFGYSVLRTNRYRSDYPIGYIVDLLALPDRPDAADALAANAVQHFDDQKVNIVNYQVAKDHLYERILKRHGFLNSRIKIYLGYKTLGMANQLNRMMKSPPKKIFFSWGDHDVLPVNVPHYI